MTAWVRSTASVVPVGRRCTRQRTRKELIDARPQSKSGIEKKYLRTAKLKPIMTSRRATASCRSYPDCRATRLVDLVLKEFE
jgi:hypothetical protein